MRIVALNDAETSAIRRATRRAAAAQARASSTTDDSSSVRNDASDDTLPAAESRGGADINVTLHRCTQKLQVATAQLRADRMLRARSVAAAAAAPVDDDDDSNLEPTEVLAERIQQTESLCRAIHTFAQSVLLTGNVLPALRDEYDAAWRRAALLCDGGTDAAGADVSRHHADSSPPTTRATVQRSPSASAAAAAAGRSRSRLDGGELEGSHSPDSTSTPSTPLNSSLGGATSSIRRMTAASRLGRTPRPGPSTSHDTGAAFDQQQLQYQTQRFVEVQDPNTDPALVAHERARLAEIQKVHAHAREVAALQADFAALVASQDDGIAQAEAQTATAADHISHGRKQLAKAIKAGAFAATIAGAAVGAVLGGPIVGMALLGAQSALTVGAATAAGGVVGVAAASAVNTRTKQSVKGAELTCNEADAAAT